MSPYTYLIGWVSRNKWYYGVRAANKCAPEDDFWKKYFTSSKVVKRFREENGEPDFILIDEIFSDPTSARIREIDFLKRAFSVRKEIWLNQNIGGEKFFTAGAPLSEEFRKRLSKIRTGKKRTPEAKMKMSNAAKLRVRLPHSEETKNKISRGRQGKKHSQETIEKIKAANLVRRSN